MAAIIQLRRGSSPSTLSYGELFVNDDSASLVVGLSVSNDIVTLTKLEQKNYGNLWLDGDITASNISASGDIRIGGQLFLGDDAADSVVIEGSLSSSLVPDLDDTFDIGTPTKNWRTLYIENIVSETTLVTSSAQITAFGFTSSSTNITSLNTFTASADQRLDSLEGDSGSYLTSLTAGIISGSSQITSLGFISESTTIPAGTISGSAQITSLGFISSSHTDITSLNSFTQSADQRLDSLEGDSGSYLTSVPNAHINTSLNSYTASNDINITNIHGTTSSLEQRVGQIESNTGSYSGGGTDISHLNTFTASNANTSLNSFTSSADQRLDSLEGDSGSYLTSVPNAHINTSLNSYTSSTDGRLDEIETTTSSLEQRVGQIEANTGSYAGGGTDISHLNTFTESADNRLDDIEAATSSYHLTSEFNTFTSSLGSSAYYDVTGSVANDSSVVPTAAAVNTAITNAGIGDITSVAAGLGMTDGGVTGDVTLTLDTGSTHFIEGTDIRLSSLNSFTASNDNGELNSFTASNDNGELNSFTASNDNGELNSFTSSFNTALTLDSSNVTVLGNLTVQGTETILNTQTLNIEDKNLLIASGAADSSAANGGGITIDGANATMTWSHSNTRLEFNKALHITGDVEATGDVVAYASSDERLKDNIQPIENPLEKLSQISGKTFDWNEDKQNIYKGRDYGVIAQEIEAVLPELVNTREDTGYKAVKYDKLVPLLIESIKELQKQIEELKSK